MKPLIVLFAVFVISIAAIKLINGVTDIPLAGRIAMAAMLSFTAIGHFAFTKGMSMMLPDFVPFKTETIYLTGLIEIAAAIGLLIPSLKHITGWLLIVFFLLLLPANIYAAIKHVDYQKGTLEGPGITYLWFRLPLQLLFILWTYLSAIRF
ncbi:DoxX family protein [Sporocytophaga myxococcoides]|uniref:DoxX family protein n=1 Tax=Sporocytophaga myxococcoides TaxID=153721 RepID=UPI00040BA76D|nr:membrane protein [Sporocytophaga myxococcoides]